MYFKASYLWQWNNVWWIPLKIPPLNKLYHLISSLLSPPKNNRGRRGCTWHDCDPRYSPTVGERSPACLHLADSGKSVKGGWAGEKGVNCGPIQRYCLYAGTVNISTAWREVKGWLWAVAETRSAVTRDNSLEFR